MQAFPPLMPTFSRKDHPTPHQDLTPSTFLYVGPPPFPTSTTVSAGMRLPMRAASTEPIVKDEGSTDSGTESQGTGVQAMIDWVRESEREPETRSA